TTWSAGPGCHGGCGVLAHIKDGRLVKIEHLLPDLVLTSPHITEVPAPIENDRVEIAER
ncbi:MAG: hypothetical protein GWP18_00770, partial [Proteobacteria bacterium]|nr:hypothetical protein [Pseudomonadota bacterium]